AAIRPREAASPPTTAAICSMPAPIPVGSSILNATAIVKKTAGEASSLHRRRRLQRAKKTAQVAACMARPGPRAYVSRQLQRLRFVFMNLMRAEGLPRLEGDARVTRLVNASGYP